MPHHPMSLDDLAGQRLLAGFDGTALNNEIRYLIHDLRVGGLILFSRNIRNAHQVRHLTSSAQDFARRCGLPPLLMAIDQEGGLVARLKSPHFREFPGMTAISSTDQAAAWGIEMATLLKDLGITMNFAPVMDAIPDGFESIMKGRVFAGDPGQVARLGSALIRAMQDRGILAVAKHFPGIGRTDLDSHHHLPRLTTSRQTLTSEDLHPFRAAIKSGVSGIMLSHILYTSLDPEWPASLSPTIADHLLRQEMGYQGLSMTDDLDMKAIQHPIQVAVRQILQAGIDLYLICHAGPDIEAAIRESRRLLGASTALRQQGMNSVGRILKAKADISGQPH